jgi:glycosyltransferase involved in cell wall biosynthesis
LTRTIAWVVNRLDTVGGGERLLQEGVMYYRSLGYRVLVCSWFYDDKASFNGRYPSFDIIQLTTQEVPRTDILSRGLSRAKTLGKLRRLLRDNNVTTVFVQGEYDVALVYVTTFLTKIAYRFLIFGQIFQYPHDSAKYALIFRRHLAKIVSSRPGYQETIPLDPPALSLKNRLANEFICAIRWLAVRKAEKRFSFSRQVQWETQLLFGRSTELAQGAFPQTLIEQRDFGTEALTRYGLESGRYILSLSRLDRKKRIDLIIAGFAASGSDLVLVIGGEGPDEPLLRRCAADSGVEDRIVFIGMVDDADMINLKHHARLFVSMDIGDYDISPLEALAVGTPVLCPTDFDADKSLVSMPGFIQVAPEKMEVAEAIHSATALPPVVDRSALIPWTWSSYFDQLISS